MTCLAILCASMVLPVSSSLLEFHQLPHSAVSGVHLASPRAITNGAVMRLRGGAETEYDSKDAEKFDRKHRAR